MWTKVEILCVRCAVGSEDTPERPDRAPGNLDDVPTVNNEAPREAGPGRVLVTDLLLYTAARLLLVVAIGGAIIGVGWLVGAKVPLLVAAIFAVLIAMPLSLYLFSTLRRRVATGIAAVDQRRQTERAALEARLRGET
jgi:hypothetical protein